MGHFSVMMVSPKSIWVDVIDPMFVCCVCGRMRVRARLCMLACSHVHLWLALLFSFNSFL